MITKFLARLRSAWRAISRSKQLNAQMDDEIRFHIEMEAERLEREGHSKKDARRQALLRFGGVEKYKEQARDTRAMPWIDALSVDGKLAARMLVKHRWLTLVGGFAMAVAIAIGSMAFEITKDFLNPALPLPDGGRIVALQYATDVPGSPERKVLHEFVALRQELASVTDLGAYRTVQRNLVAANSTPEPIQVAEITAAGFTLARTPPLLGRYLVPDDERLDAPAVLVIGHRPWQQRFAGDPAIVGQTINVGGTPSTVIGVMPEGFRFPTDHDFWAPLRENPLAHERFQGPELRMFGRLAPGVSLEQAQAEFTTVGLRRMATQSGAPARLRPVVLSFAREQSSLDSPVRVWTMWIALMIVSALSFVVAANLAILIYARTVARLGELAIRTALGASRRRILAQLFMEALALCLVGAGAGLVIANIALDRMRAFIFLNGSLPFWIRVDLSIASVGYALAIAVIAAFVMGVLPGLKATGRRLNNSLHELNGRAGTRLGSVWTSLVVAQIAVAVAVLPAAVYLSWLVVRMEVIGAGFVTDPFVVSVVAMGDDTEKIDANRARTRQIELMNRLGAEPGVSAVTFSSSVPGFGPEGRFVQLADSPDDRGGFEVSHFAVGVDMMSVYGAAIVAGRAFNARDLGAANAVIVNRTFLEKLGSPSASLGASRFRYKGRPATYQIVGVVSDFPRFPPSPSLDGQPVVYHPAAIGDIPNVVITAKFAGAFPDGVADRFRKIAAEIDPALQVRHVGSLSAYYRDLRSIWRYLAWGAGLVTMSVLLLSAAGIYALMSLTVAQRTREIGIRSALGAQPRRLLVGILARSVRQISIGVVVGSLLSGLVFQQGGFGFARACALLLAVATVMLIVGVFSSVGPARRILRIQATDALK
jgi:putative ABC transport system permease protein